MSFPAISTARSTTSVPKRGLSFVPLDPDLRARALIISCASLRDASRISAATRWPSETASWIRCRLLDLQPLQMPSYSRRIFATSAFSCSIRSNSRESAPGARAWGKDDRVERAADEEEKNDEADRVRDELIDVNRADP